MVDPKETTVAQTHEPPMTRLDAVKDHAAAMRALLSWDRVGVLMDEGPHAVVTVLLKGDTVVSASRFCLSVTESVAALREYNEGSVAPMELRCWQGHTMTGEQTRSLAELTIVWRESSGQRKDHRDIECIEKRLYLIAGLGDGLERGLAVDGDLLGAQCRE